MSTLFAVGFRGCSSSATFRVVDFWVLLVGLQSRTLGSIWDSLETFAHLDVSKNRGFYPPNHPILIGFSIINHPFWGPTPVFGNTHSSLLAPGW